MTPIDVCPAVTLSMLGWHEQESKFWKQTPCALYTLTILDNESYSVSLDGTVLDLSSWGFQSHLTSESMQCLTSFLEVSKVCQGVVRGPNHITPLRVITIQHVNGVQRIKHIRCGKILNLMRTGDCCDKCRAVNFTAENCAAAKKVNLAIIYMLLCIYLWPLLYYYNNRVLNKYFVGKLHSDDLANVFVYRNIFYKLKILKKVRIDIQQTCHLRMLAVLCWCYPGSPE